ncbi:phospholipid transfer protein C2CD2L-like isoform X2 [Conger conger]|uniref:phospholipid transfer protein C2CD2L-like isoform X2 n=1 Tax=Conger conger TaxID=82655 RepID=UPI002A5B0014|nr:phospholipid transfer protein C2CD2L-like isoform X2 [Conger conger]
MIIWNKNALLHVGGRSAASWALPGSLKPHNLARGVWGSLQKLRLGRNAGVGDPGMSAAGAKSLLSSLFSFRSFRENCQQAWIRALNDQACRHGCSIQITFEDNLQLSSSASIDQVTCMDQSACTMVLQCNCEVDTVTFPVTVTEQSPAAVSVDAYQVTIAPAQVQLMVSLEEVEEEGLLVSWSFSQQPLLSLAVSPCRAQQEGCEEKVDVNMIRDLVENAIVSTHPAMMVHLKACESSASPAKGQNQGRSSPSPDTPLQRIIVCQLRVTGLRGGGAQLLQLRELCCALDLDPPTQKARSAFLPVPARPGAELEWNEDLALDLDADTKGLEVRLVERNSMGEKFLPGHASIPLDLSRRTPAGQQVLSVSTGSGPTATVILELVFLEPGNAHSSHCHTQPCASPNPTQEAETENNPMTNSKMVFMAPTAQTQPFPDCKPSTDSASCSPHKVRQAEIAGLREPCANSSPTSSLKVLLSNGLDPMDDTAIRHLIMKQMSSKRGADTGLQGEHSLQGNNSDGSSSQRVIWQDCDEAARSSNSERPSTDDLESESGSTGALETRSLKDHKVGFLHSGTKLLFRRRAQQKDPCLSRSHEDVSNLGHSSVTRKKSGSFSQRLIKRFSFHSRSKNKASANTNGAPATTDD